MHKKTVLKNGLKIITSHMPHMESVSIGVWIGVGARYEEKRLCGMSHLIEHMLFKGTLTRAANVLKEAIEGVGGSFNGFTSEEATCYLVKLPSVYTKLGLDILSDMVLNSKLDPAELEKEKYVICEEIKMYMDHPGHHVFDILAETMWPNHALGRPIAGYNDTIKRFKREDLTGFMNKYYVPANVSVVLCGKLGKSEECVSFLKNTFRRPSPKRSFSYTPVTVGRSARIKPCYKDTKQSHLAFGFHSARRSHPLRYAVAILNIILGGNMSSRLFERLREQNPLCYEISSSVRRYKETGAFVIHAGIDNAKLEEATAEIIRELTTIKENCVTKDELKRAKEYLSGQLLLALEDTASRMLWLGERIVLEGKAPDLKKIVYGVNKVTTEDVKCAANMIFKKKNLNFATIGPAGKDIGKKLKKLVVL
ncbi:MAG: insulinase family protein [Omnitrophica bacterium]|nr:insulinase family protein [Candidatus Omnitrophota bacterium]